MNNHKGNLGEALIRLGTDIKLGLASIHNSNKAHGHVILLIGKCIRDQNDHCVVIFK